MKQQSLFGQVPSATFSACEEHASCAPACVGRRYRYVLTWPTGLNAPAGSLRGDGRHALFVLANPSTATDEKPDPTVAKCIKYSRRWGYGWCRVVNVRAWRETDPTLVPADPRAISEPAHPELNDLAILENALLAGVVICGWGKLGGERGTAVLSRLRAANVLPYALHVNKDGSPHHPLYLSDDLDPIPYGRGP